MIRTSMLCLLFGFTYLFSSAQFFGEQQVISKTAAGPIDHLMADIDGNGSLDLVTLRTFDRSLVWHEIISPSTVTEHIISCNIREAAFLRAGDMDNDGDVDLIVGRSTQPVEGFGVPAPEMVNGILYFENIGGGLFEEVSLWEDDGDLLAVELADVDGDDDLDIGFLTLPDGSTDASILWMSNDGSASFNVYYFVISGMPSVRTFKWSDVDGDGDVDLLMASPSEDKIAVLDNNGSGAFDLGSFMLVTTSTNNVSRMELADLNDDGLDDLVTIAEVTNKIIFYRATSSGVFMDPIDLWPFSDNAMSMSLADIDGDGRVDIVLGLQASNTFHWYRNTTLGTDITFSSIISLGISTELQGLFGISSTDKLTMLWEDIDGDDDLDLIYSLMLEDYYAIWTNDGAGVMEEGFIVLSSDLKSPIELVMGDLGNGGSEDFFVASVSPGVKLYRSFGGGFIGQGFSVGDFTETYRNIEIVDMDQDGDLDLVASTLEKVFLFTNTAGTLGPQQVLISGVDLFISDMEIADMDNDGDMDIVLHEDIESLQYPITWYVNDGSTNFIDRFELEYMSTFFTDMRLADMNGNGFPDVVMVIDFVMSIGISISFSDAAGGYEPFQQLDVDIESGPFAEFVDIDGDGDLDILGVGLDGFFVSQHIMYSENDGAGGFGLTNDEQQISLYENIEPEYVIAEDMNGNGLLDLIISDENQIKFIKNLGGTYADPILVSDKVNGIIDIVISDVDTDGQPDIVTLSKKDNKLAWYRNEGAGCPEDINSDGVVNILDFIAFNSAFGSSCLGCPEDINGDGVVNILDFIQFNSAFGSTCE